MKLILSIRYQRFIAVYTVLASLVFFLFSPDLDAASGSLSREKHSRAVMIARLKNNFVQTVLDTYHIAYKVNVRGVITKINVQDTWENVSAIDIIPEIQKEAGLEKVIHNIYFQTEKGLLHLSSDIVIRPQSAQK